MKNLLSLLFFTPFYIGVSFSQPGTNDPSFNTFDDGTFGDGTGFDGYVLSTSIQDDGKIIVGGYFTSFNGIARNKIVRLNTDGSIDTGFDPGTGFDIDVYSISLQDDGKIIVGGSFSSFNGTTRNKIARLNSEGSLDTSFDPGTGFDGEVLSTSLQDDGKIIVGGQFTSFNGIARNKIARLNADGSLDTLFDSGTGFDGTVHSISLQSDGKAIIGGEFISFNGTSRKRIARLNSDGSLDTGFDLGIGFDGAVHSISLQSDGKIIAWGEFTSFNGTAKSGIARLNTDGSLDTGFDLGTGLDGKVNSISIQDDGKIIVGGQFTSFNGIARNRIARLNADGSLDNGFDPGAGFNQEVYSISIQSDGKIIVGGWFSSFNGTTRSMIARLNADGSLDTGFDLRTGFNSTVLSTSIQDDGKIIVGGWFSSFNGTARSMIARLNADGSLDTGFDPGAGFNGSVVYSISIQSDGKIIVGGWFSSFNGTGRNGIARLNTNGSLDTGFNPGTGFTGTGFDGRVRSTSVQDDGKIIVGGNFTHFNGTARNKIARLDADGSLDNGFDPGAGFNQEVYSISIQSDGKIIVGGNFTHFNGIARNRIARLNSNGSLDNGFDPGMGFSSIVWSTSIQDDGKIIVGGQFSSFHGTARNGIARLNPAGFIDAGFDPGTGLNQEVFSTSIQDDGKIIVGGNFTYFNGIARNRIARLNADGSLDTGFDQGTGFNSTVRSTSIQGDDKIIVGGSFTSYNGIWRNKIARLLGDPPSSINYPDNKENVFSVYPNPATNHITISSKLDFQKVAVKISTITGQVLMETKVNSGKNHSVDMSQYAPGLYFIEINHKGERNRMRIVKN